MGYHHIEEIINNFLEAGMNKNMPCAIISKGCTKEQKVIKGNIANIVSLAKKEPLKAPVVIVIGECVDLNLKGNAFGNFENKRNYNELKIGVVGTQNFTKKFIIIIIMSSNTQIKIIRIYRRKISKKSTRGSF